jgi:sugar O-acyltransferase (sialic acid O-acetyltransferase NeuD family)
LSDNRPVAILGAGGHGRVVLDVLRAAGRKVTGFLDERGFPGGVNGVAMLGRPELVFDPRFLSDHDVIVAVGESAVRRRFSEAILDKGGVLATAVHPSCVVSPTAFIDVGTVVFPGAVINANASIGKFCIVNTGATIDHDVVLEDGTQAAPGVNMGGGSHCEVNVLVAIGAVVLPGVRIGAGAILAAGATAVSDIPPAVTAFGTPARWR